jgi:5-methyltetrahydropteroyltriglutamate--homocysteine methyltransferase
MKQSTSRILTTHTGSLPRSPQLQELLRAREEHQPLDQHSFEASVRQAVADVVKMQLDIGLDVINDGEQGWSQYATYVKERLSSYLKTLNES